MTWFKVDDHLWSHPKVLHTSSAAIGVWARVGSYCADQLTDGLIERRTIYSICPDSRRVVDRAIAELVSVGLWEVVAEDGWQYHDWHDHQPTREGVQARRKANADRVRAWREQQKSKSAADPPNATVTPLPSRL